jgi:hypothetical protein
MAAPTAATELSPARTILALVVGLVFCVLIWIFTPYNNYLLYLGAISGNYIPPSALFLIFLTAAFLNPILRLFGRGLYFTRRQLALILAMMLVACVTPGQGLLRLLPYALGDTVVTAAEDRDFAAFMETADLPPSLFPGPVGYDADVTPMRSFFAELLPGESIPWNVWLPPLLSWGTFFLFLALLFVGGALLVYPQWRENERLAFPLLDIEGRAIDPPGAGGVVGGLYRNVSFWVGLGLVFTIYLFVALSEYFPEDVPSIPLSWNLSPAFSEKPFVYMAWYLKQGRLIFAVLVIAYLMPARMSFSIWATAAAYGIWEGLARSYAPQLEPTSAIKTNHLSGAAVTLTIAILWLGRKHWWRVARLVVRPGSTGEDHRDRWAGILFALGLIGCFAFFLWTGVQPVWALVFVAMAVSVSLLVTRFVAETGFPVMRVSGLYPADVMRMVPTGWLAAPTLFMGAIVYLLIHIASSVNGMALAIHGLALDPKMPPRRKPRLAVLLVAVMVLGLLVAGAAHIHFSYHHSETLDHSDSPISSWGVKMMRQSYDLFGEWEAGQFRQPRHNQWAHLALGAGAAGVLEYACLLTPKWPLHPIGLLIAPTWQGRMTFGSVFLGWLLKMLLLRYGGGRLYEAAKPFFIGLIMGEVTATVFWAIVPAVLVSMGEPYTPVTVMPL